MMERKINYTTEKTLTIRYDTKKGHNKLIQFMVDYLKHNKLIVIQSKPLKLEYKTVQVSPLTPGEHIAEIIALASVIVIIGLITYWSLKPWM